MNFVDCIEFLGFSFTRAWLRLGVWLFSFSLISVGGFAQANRPTDFQIKAAYLYNFGRFVEWPPSSLKNDNFVVCVLGRDPFGPALDKVLTGETISGKPVMAKRISNPQESNTCQILFLNETDEDHLTRLLGALDKEAVLTVSDAPRFSQRGGMIQFVMDGQRVRFEVNLAATQHAGLALSSELLRVASTVHRSGE
jgi:YfiR/HmsC-like